MFATSKACEGTSAPVHELNLSPSVTAQAKLKLRVAAMRRTLVATTLMGLATLGAAIYPDGHFDVSHKMTVANFDDIVKKEVDAGKTLFVRWIASAGSFRVKFLHFRH